MIVYLSTRKHAYTLAVQLHFFPGELANRVRLLPYEWLDQVDDLPVAAYIFSDLDRLNPDGLERAARFADWLIELDGDTRVLNHPRSVLQRYALLRTLFESGINTYNVYRVDQLEEVRTFPVFMRRENDHRGPITGLIATLSELRACIRRLAPGGDDHGLMIVEYCESRIDDGFYRKFGGYRVGEHTYLQHCYITPDWIAKDIPAGLSEAHMEEAENYRLQHPHEKEMRRVFDLAKIDYGRIDYTVADAGIQVFEINTNPTVLSHPWIINPLINQAKFAKLHETAMLSVDCEQDDQLAAINPLLGDRRRFLSVDQVHRLALRQTIRRANIHFGWKAVRRPVKHLLSRWAR